MGDAESKSWMSCLGWGCLTVVVLSALGIGGCVWLAYRGGSEAHQVVEDYLQAVDEGRFEEAYGRLGSRFKDGQRLDEFVAFERAARRELGRCAVWRLAGTALNRDLGRSTAVLTYRLDCEEGVAEAVFNLERNADGWVIQGLGYREPGAATLPSCPACGEVVPPAARFCPSCGAALVETMPVRSPGSRATGTEE